jgi:type I restriction enzyme, S subunit
MLNSFNLRCLYCEIVPDYIKLVLMSPHTMNRVNYLMYGMKMPRLGTNDAVALIVPLPPLAEQHRIVAKVDELMALCDQLQAERNRREAWRDQLVASSLHQLAIDQTTEEKSPPPWRGRVREGGELPLATMSPPAPSPTPQPPPVKGGGAFGRDALFLQNLPRLTTRTEHIKQLRQAILNLAVRGRLVPQDPNDEPAAELLKQIQAEKVRLVKEGVQKKEVVLPALDLNRAPFALPFGWSWARFPELGKFGRGKSKHRPRCHHQ